MITNNTGLENKMPLMNNLIKTKAILILSVIFLVFGFLKVFNTSAVSLPLNDEFTSGNWQANWVIDSAAGNLTPIAGAEPGKTDLIVFRVPSGSVTGKNGTNKIMTKGGDTLGYGTYEARFKLKDVGFQNASTGVYVGMGLWNFTGPTQQEVMMGFYYEPGAHDYIQLLTTKDRPRSMADDPSNIYHSKISDPGVLLNSFSGTYRTIKFDYQPGIVRGYLDGNLILTKTDLIPSEPMTLVIGARVTGGTLLSDLNVVWDYVKISTSASAACGSQIAGSYKYRVLKEGNDVNVCDNNNAKVHSNTDASESIQWAINNLTPGRSSQEKIITQTDLTINSTISPKSFVYLEIRGVLRMGGFNYDLINFSDQHDVTIAGPIDGFGELIGQGKTVGTTGWGIRTQGGGSKNQNIIFKNLKAHDFRQSGIALNKLSSGTGLVENCICNNNGQNGIGFGDSTGVISKNNYAEGNRDAGVQFEDVWNFQVINNQCIANGRHNLQIEHGVGGQITNGKYNNGVGDGIQIRNRVPPDVGISENITISGVEAKNNTTDGLVIISSQNITVQSGIFSNNGTNGIRYNDSTGDGSVKNNTVDIITHNNGARGFWIENSTINNISGSMIACGNATADLTLLGTSSTFNVYHVAGTGAPVINKGSNTVNVIDFTCNPKSVSGVWAVDKICAVGGICGVPAVSPAPSQAPSPAPSSSSPPSASPTVTTLDIPFVPPLLIGGVKGLVDTIINWLVGLASLIVVLFLIIGGIMYVGSSGDEERIKRAKKIINYTIIGLIILLISYTVFSALVDMIWG